KNPAENNVLIEALADTPYITIGMLGGMITPRHPAAATSAIANFLSYPFSIMVGTIIVPIAATVAGPDPEIAPKNKHATTVTIDKPPANCPTNESKKFTNRFDRPPPSINVPESIKNGMAISGKESQAVNMPPMI